MKNLLIALGIFCAGTAAKAQDIAGSWMGVIPVGAIKLHVVFNIKHASDTGYTATFDSPDQKAFGIPCGSAVLKKDSLSIGIAAISGGYNGLWNGKDSISGVYHQHGGKILLNLKRITEAEKTALANGPVRSQTPRPPYGYYSQDVEYDNADKSLHYGATFTRPNGSGKYPAVIIISGSGTQDRNGDMFGHKPYWVLADYLTKHGIAVLRVDDRGAGKSSPGKDIKDVTSLELSYDVEASLNYLENRPDVDKKHIGLIGHSEGGIIAPMVAARRMDVAFIVMWGAPEVGGAGINTEQNAYLLKKAGIDSAAIAAFKQVHLQILRLFASSPSEAALDEKITPVFDAWKKEQPESVLKALYVHDDSMAGKNVTTMYNSLYDLPWMRFFISYQPEKDLGKVKCPVLAVIGQKDTQVEPGPNLDKIKEVLTESGNHDFEVKELPGLNHLLQTANTGDVSEYEKIPETMSPMAMQTICSWIKLHDK